MLIQVNWVITSVTASQKVVQFAWIHPTVQDLLIFLIFLKKWPVALCIFEGEWMHVVAGCGLWRLCCQFCTLGQLSENASEWCADVLWKLRWLLLLIFFYISTISALAYWCLSMFVTNWKSKSLCQLTHMWTSMCLRLLFFLSLLAALSSWSMASWPLWFFFWWWSWRSAL